VCAPPLRFRPIGAPRRPRRGADRFKKLCRIGSGRPEVGTPSEVVLIVALDHQAKLVVDLSDLEREDVVLNLFRVGDTARWAGVLGKTFPVPTPHVELDELSGFERSPTLWIIEVSDGFAIIYSNEAHHEPEPFPLRVIGDSRQCCHVALTRH
jgi:hypothetical protein